MTSAEVQFAGSAGFEKRDDIACLRVGAPDLGEYCGALARSNADPDARQRPRPRGTLKCRFA